MLEQKWRHQLCLDWYRLISQCPDKDEYWRRKHDEVGKALTSVYDSLTIFVVYDNPRGLTELQKNIEKDNSALSLLRLRQLYTRKDGK